MTFEKIFEEICHHKLTLNKFLPKDFEDKKLSLAEKYDLNKKPFKYLRDIWAFFKADTD